ncbi:MAG: DnaJ domain-containing protein [Chitinophagales bacterium]|nr:DnaJ domain-containing protein [Chitinophagales bacterium]
MKNYYNILGVPESADQSAIKKAYHLLAKKYHPDRNPNSSWAEERFKEIAEAYETLSDTIKKANYDHLRKQQQAKFNYQYKGDFRGYQYNQQRQQKASTPPPPKKKIVIPSRVRTALIPAVFFIIGGLGGWIGKSLLYKNNPAAVSNNLYSTFSGLDSIPSIGLNQFEINAKWDKQLKVNAIGKIDAQNATILQDKQTLSGAHLMVNFLDSQGNLVHAENLYLDAAILHKNQDIYSFNLEFNLISDLSYEDFIKITSFQLGYST